MWPLLVAILDPGSDLDPCVGHAEEQGLVHQFFAHPAVEALDLTVLHLLARSGETPLHADLLAPCQYGIAGELGAIVADGHAQLAPLCDQPAQIAHHTVLGDRGVRHSRQALSGHVIDHIEHPEPSARSQLVMDEV